jgi:hypothetical protein
MHLKMRFQMHLKNAFKRWEIFSKGSYLILIKVKRFPLYERNVLLFLYLAKS